MQNKSRMGYKKRARRPDYRSPNQLTLNGFETPFDQVGLYKSRFGYYPEKVLADKIYCTRANRQFLKTLGIKLHAKPLGPPSASALSNHVSPGERNPIEGKIRQAKAGYNMECIKAKLKATSESWIASIVLVLNLKNLLRGAPYSVILSVKFIRRVFLQMLSIGTGRMFWRLSF